jgi:hypothetical protein
VIGASRGLGLGTKKGEKMSTTENYNQAEEFIQTLYPSNKLTFQTFTKPETKDTSRIIYSTLQKCWDTLVDLNSKQAGIYSMVNTGTGKGRNNNSVSEIINLFLDLDGSPLQPILDLTVKPHIILASSEGRYQARWRIKAISVQDYTRYQLRLKFKQVQIALANKFSGDPTNNDLARVARIPGFVNYKHHSPYLVQTIQQNKSPILSLDEFIEAFSLVLPTYSEIKISESVDINIESIETIVNTTRNVSLFNIGRQLAQKGLAGDDLLEALQQIREERCEESPDFDENEVYGIYNSISEYWYGFDINIEGYIDKIKTRNPDMIKQSGLFYRYDTYTNSYRIVSVKALRNYIFEISRHRAGSVFIDNILDKLSESIPNVPPDVKRRNPETEFLEENIIETGKVALKDIYKRYVEWCKEKELKPLAQTVLRRELENRYGVELKKIKVKGKTIHGFLNLSLDPNTQSTSPSSPDKNVNLF